MKWSKRIIVGCTHHDMDNDGRMPFGIVKYPSGKIELYDLRDPSKGAPIYTFTTIREAKRIAIQALTDNTVLEPYLDKKWIENSKRFVDLMAKTDAILDRYKNE